MLKSGTLKMRDCVLSLE